jgi:hypothetical protein
MPAPDKRTRVTMVDGISIDISPLVSTARDFRRNTLRAAEANAPFHIGLGEMKSILFGMQIAAAALFGRDAEQVFRDQVHAVLPPKIHNDPESGSETE